MDHAAALRMAIDLMHFPSQVRLIRSSPLPADIVTLLRIVADDEEAISQAMGATGRSRETVHEAAAFFIEQILLHPEADSYRVLGARTDAASGELRRNMALLLRWLHPDHAAQGAQSIFIARVTRAWNDLKTLERRRAYDLARRVALAQKASLRKRGNVHLGNQVSTSRLHKDWSCRRHPGSPRSVKFKVRRVAGLRRFLLLLLGRVVQ